MKTETTSGGMGKLVLRLILSILLVFSLLGTVGCAVGCRLWESINNIVVKDRRNEIVFISAEQRAALFDFLNTHEKLKGSDLLKLLGLSKTYGYRLGEQFKTGIQGNKTRVEIERALGNYPDKKRLLQFNLQEESSSMVNTETGEIIPMISLSFEQISVSIVSFSRATAISLCRPIS